MDAYMTYDNDSHYHIANYLVKYYSEISSVTYAMIDLDLTDLSIPDILRNIHKTYPLNTENRNHLIDGEMVIVVLCKSKLLTPLKGIFIIVSNEAILQSVVSKEYIFFNIPETNIRNDLIILDTINAITDYMIKNYREIITDFNDLYAKFIYDGYEEEVSKRYDN